MLICLNIALNFTLYRIVKYFDHLKKKLVGPNGKLVTLHKGVLMEIIAFIKDPIH